MLLTGGLCCLALRLFWWYVEVQHTPVSKAATVLGAAVAAMKLLVTHNLPAALVSGVVAGFAASALVWVDRRFHSLASIPVWLVLSWLLAVVLLGAI